MRALPTADGFLTAFFERRRGEVRAGERDRLDRTECDLRLALEIGGEWLLTDADRTVLAAERQFDRLGAVARTMPLPALPLVLERFVRDPLYRPTPADEVRDRLGCCADLVRALAQDPDLAGSTRRLRRVDEAIRMEQAAASPRRRRPTRRVRG